MNENRTFKKYILGMLGCMILEILLCNLAAGWMLRQLRQSYYNAVAQLIGKVQETEMQAAVQGGTEAFVGEEERIEINWVQVFNETGYQQSGSEVLERYGIFSRDFPFEEQNKAQRRFYLELNGVLLLMNGAVLLLFVGYQRRREARIQELNSYIRQIERGIYTLDMEENAEDDLSLLKNELYKVMVLLKEAALQSQNQQKVLAESMSDISHQLKTPMTSLTLLLDNLSENEDMDVATRRQFLAEMTKQVTHMNWLVATLLKLSRLDSGAVIFQPEQVDIVELVQEVLEQLEIMAEWKRLHLRLQVEPENPMSDTGNPISGVIIQADRYWMKEALLNLVKNAIEHSPEEGIVSVKVEQNAVYTAIAVHNDGDIIPEQEQLHIFERFYRSSHAKKDSVGIGLALAKTVMERHHGYITVSSNEAEGTEFMVKILANI